MRHTKILALVAAFTLLVTGGLVQAGEGTAKADAKGKKAAKEGNSAQQLIDKFDKNGDGKLDANELAAAVQDRQEKHAKAEKVVKSGKSASELGADSNTARAEELIKKFDTNGDHKLDATELQNMLNAGQAEHAGHKKAGNT
ncbi:MAG TPA: EF-hand domain-containing protein [Pirellulales bacterium]|nr:EF-hand domain-containing protein [Pirellulales bacterium]